MIKIIISLYLTLFTMLSFSQTEEMWFTEDRSLKTLQLNKIIGIDTQLLNKSYDTSLIIFYRTSVFQLLKKKDSLTIVHTVSIQKLINRKFQWLSSHDTVYNAKINGSTLTNELFTFLFNIGNKYPYVRGWSANAGIDPGNFHMHSISQGNYSYHECLHHYLDNVYYINLNLLTLLDRLIQYCDHWKKLDKLIKAKGDGTYGYGTVHYFTQFNYSKNRFSFFVGKQKVQTLTIPKVR